MNETAEAKFRLAVQERLGKLDDRLTRVLRSVIEHDYPSEVVAIAFEVFHDSFTTRFPVQTFFLDSSNSEHFVYENGEARYPSAVDPELLHIERVYAWDLEEEAVASDPDLDVWATATSELIPWFAKCWDQAGGAVFTRKATIGGHDAAEEFNLITRQWQAR